MLSIGHFRVCENATCRHQEDASSSSAARGTRFKHCSRCKVSYYCSKSCQTAHWPVHKKLCCQIDSSNAPALEASKCVERLQAFLASPERRYRDDFRGAMSRMNGFETRGILVARFGNVHQAQRLADNWDASQITFTYMSQERYLASVRNEKNGRALIASYDLSRSFIVDLNVQMSKSPPLDMKAPLRIPRHEAVYNNIGEAEETREHS